MPRGKRKLAAILFTDIVGFSAMSHKNEANALAVLEDHNRLLRDLFERFDGIEIKSTGDGFLIQFDSAVKAVLCALEIQDTLARRNAQMLTNRRFRVRIGIHIGEIVSQDEDVLGNTVNIAARILSATPPESIYVSQAAYEQVRNKIEALFVDEGVRQLRNIPEPVRVYEVKPEPGHFFEKNWHRFSAFGTGILRRPLPTISVALGIAIGLMVLSVSNRGEGTPERVPMFDRRRVAVLPFKWMSLNPKDEYLADGVTDELITTLSKKADVRVLSYSTVAGYKGTTKPPMQIARELGVGTLVEGRVQIWGKEIKVTTQMVDVKTQESVFSHDESGALENLFNIQKKLAAPILAKFQIGAPKEPSRAIASIPPEGAYLKYLKAKFFYNRRTGESLKKTVVLLEEAIKEAPAFAPPYTLIGNAYGLLGYYGHMDPQDAFEAANPLVGKGLFLDPNSEEAYLFVAERKSVMGDGPGAESAFKKAIELNPRYATAYQWYGEFLETEGRFDEAKKRLQIAYELEPMSLVVQTARSVVRYFSGENEDAITGFKNVIEMDPEYMISRYWLGLAYLRDGQVSNALLHLQKSVDLSGNSPMTLAALAVAKVAAGKREEAKKIYAELKLRAKKTYVPRYFLVQLATALDEKEEAFNYLREAIRRMDRFSMYRNTDPLLNPLRKEAAWAELSKKR